MNQTLTVIFQFLCYRYLIVLDDLDNGDHWIVVKDTFDAMSGEGSRIIVTTRLRFISNQCRNHGSDSYVYQMRALGEHSCKQISGLEDDHQHSEKLLKTCGGHPLALSSVKNHLVGIGGMRTPGECKALCDKLGKFLHDAQEDDSNNFSRLRGVLMDNLVGLRKSTDRSRLLYLGIFPNGCPIKRSRLTRRWVAEGYHPAGDDSIKKFLERNIIQPIGISKSSKEWKACQTLSILQKFALHKSRSDNFMMAVDDGLQDDNPPSSTWTNAKRKVRHISVSARDVETSRTTDLTCVRSLTVSKKEGLGGSFTKFSEYDLLRVLDMEDCCDVELDTYLNDISNLWNLRYLSLGTSIPNPPHQVIRKLLNLESLRLSKLEVSELPVQVLGMPYLKHLIGKVKFTYDRDKDALLLSQDSNLETIAGAVASAEDKGFLVNMMPKMKKLKKVKIWCTTSKGDIKVLDTLLFQAIEQYTRTEFEKLKRSLSIDFNDLTQAEMKKLQNQGTHYNFFKKYLEETTSNKSYLNSLKLHGTLTSTPNFLAKLSGLAMLCLSFNNLKQEHVTCLSELDTLAHLKLITDDIGSNPLEIPVKGFQKLESICFEVKSRDTDLRINIQSTVLERGETVYALPNLVSLQLLCEGLPDPSGIQITHIRKLQEIDLHHKFEEDARRIDWEDAAWNHPNRPTVLPLESLDDPDIGTATEEPAAPGVTNVLPSESAPVPADIPDAGAVQVPADIPDDGDGAQERLGNDGILVTPTRLVTRLIRNFILWR